MKTIESNKLIAKFMPHEFWVNMGYPNQPPDNYILFHTSWDWLIPCIMRIQEYIDANNNVKIFFEKNSYAMYHTGDLYITCNITDTYELIIEFIKWYNENN